MEAPNEWLPPTYPFEQITNVSYLPTSLYWKTCKGLFNCIYVHLFGFFFFFPPRVDNGCCEPSLCTIVARQDLQYVTSNKCAKKKKSKTVAGSRGRITLFRASHQRSLLPRENLARAKCKLQNQSAWQCQVDHVDGTTAGDQ